MTDLTPLPRNPRYLSIPTLLASLLCAHVIHMGCGTFGIEGFNCILLYLFGLAAPIAIKRAFTPDNLADHNAFLGPQDVSRLPTSRFSTTPGDH